jgi:mycothiol synthase
VPVSIATVAVLDLADQRYVRDLADRVEADDGAPPLSDQALGRLDSDTVRHIVAVDGGLVGYAQVDATTAEVLGQRDAIDPLLDAVESAVAEFEIWTHGTGSRLVAAVERRGYRRDRVLWQLRWPVGNHSAIALPDGVHLRSFVPGRDESAWLAVNAAAFAHHPEQGGWTSTDLMAREREQWFDPAGLLLAEHGTELVGFHWTKMHTSTLGEVYVLGVAPNAQGMHLGSALLDAGLRYLRNRGATEVMLYVDDDNTPAMALYEGHGFRRIDHDAQYRRGS